MKCKKITVLITTILLVAFQATGQSNDELADKASKSYNNKQYAEAITFYEKIVALGYQSSSLYYNLGNSYYRNNNIPEAILYFEKALKLSPNNEDIKHNIEVINSTLTDKVETVPELFYKRWWKSILNMMDINLFAIMNIVLLTLALLLLAIYIGISNQLIRKISFWTGITLLFLFGISIIATSQRNHYITDQHEAIIFTETVNIKSSPDENSKDIFVLHEGTKVTLLDVVSNWQEIRISNGSVGWIKTSDIRKI